MGYKPVIFSFLPGDEERFKRLVDWHQRMNGGKRMTRSEVLREILKSVETVLEAKVVELPTSNLRGEHD